MADLMFGSICLSAVPKELFRRVKCKDGQERIYLNIKVGRRKEVKYGNTHYISCEPPKEERKEGVNYFCGDLKEYVQQAQAAPTPEDVFNAPRAAGDELPF